MVLILDSHDPNTDQVARSLWVQSFSFFFFLWHLIVSNIITVSFPEEPKRTAVTAFHFKQINVIPQHGIPKAAAQRANQAEKESKRRKMKKQTRN